MEIWIKEGGVSREGERERRGRGGWRKDEWVKRKEEKITLLRVGL